MMPHFIKFNGYTTRYNHIQEVDEAIMNTFWLISDKRRDYDLGGILKL